MQRFEIRFPTAMLKWLNAQATRRGVCVAEIVRGFIQQKIDEGK